MSDFIARKNTLIIMLLCLITSMGRFVIDNSLPSLPAIAAALNAHADSVQLTLTLYIFGFGLSQLVCGPLSDRFGRKKILYVYKHFVQLSVGAIEIYRSQHFQEHIHNLPFKLDAWLAKTFHFIFLVTVKSTKLYHYVCSGIHFAWYISNKKAGIKAKKNRR